MYREKSDLGLFVQNQAEIRSYKESYYKNKVHNMKDYDVSKWWKEIRKLGYGSSNYWVREPVQ